MSRTVSGRTVVLAMLGFAVLVTGAMWAYWEAYTRPFRPLQHAINAEFPGSIPRVIGGEQKSHKGEYPSTLRIVIRVDFDPTDAPEAVVEPYTSRLLALAAEHLDLSPYEQIEIHLVHRVPESAIELRSFVFATEELERQNR